MKTTLKTVRTGSVGNCYIVSCDEHHLLLDVGVHYKEIHKALEYDIIGIDAALVTHVHGDHISGVKYWLTMGVDVLSNKQVVEAYPGVEFIRAGYVRNVHGWKVIPFVVPHDATENYGYLIKLLNGEQLLYATDFAYIPKTFKTYKIEHFLLECNYMDYDEVEGSGDAFEKRDHVIHGHAPLGVVKDFLEANMTDAMKTVTLCHLSRENADSKKILKEIKRIVPDNVTVSIATKGSTVVLEEGENTNDDE